MVFSGVVFGFMAAVTGCSSSGGGNDTQFSFKDPSGEPIKAVVKTTVPLAYAASVAMSAVTGSVPPNIKVNSTDCTATPAGCYAVITITDDDSSVPLQLTTGTITVLGYWFSPTDAVLTVSFSGEAGSSLFPVHNISLFPVSKIVSSLKIVYANIDINATVKDPATLSSQELNAAFLKINLTPSSDAS